ncbi:hypothetical protein G6F47_012793 [Rhizopus delemar]|nr:hypothetical protein G6F54_012628 [Rhizopus delemar]KAG1493897.1 hypothetical protein G6F53_012670 [Rhizopus delemar]KAG1579427.1 hypothetical protein G6F47_012793 [Rhizopus delemar]
MKIFKVYGPEGSKINNQSQTGVLLALEMMRLVHEAAPSRATSDVPASSTARDVAGSGAAVTSQQQYKLKKEDKESTSKMYAALKDDEMWTLSSGKKSEYFSEEKLEEIKNESAPEVTILPVELSELKNDTCFDMTDIVVASGERASRASSERMNVGRSLGAFDGIERKKVGTKVDLLFSIEQIEYQSCCRAQHEVSKDT